MGFKFNPLTGQLDQAGSGGSPSGSPNTVAIFNGAGNLVSKDDWAVDNTGGGIFQNVNKNPDGNSGNFPVNTDQLSLRPLQNSPDETWTVHQFTANIDPDSDGFDIGTSGQAITSLSSNINHQGTSNIGSVDIIRNNINLGNGTDPIDVNGVGYAFGFGNINDNVNLSGPVQGYGLNLNVSSNASMDDTEFVKAFYDNMNFAIATPGWESFQASPAISSITNNHNYNGVSLNPTIDDFEGNAGFTGVGVSGNLGTFDTGGFTGVNVNANIDMVQYANGLSVTMDNVTVYPGVAASVVIQDLTFAADLPGTAANAATIEYTGGGTAGAEVVSNIGLAYSCQIEDGVSTAQNIFDAFNAYFAFTINANVTITGTASNPQTIQGPTNFANGEDPGNKKAAYLDGDVEITGSLTFGGALSIGKLNAFASQALVTGSGSPASIHTLISAPTIAANQTVTSADTMGINTASLISIGDNASVSTDFLGLVALGLPAVVSMGSGSTVDEVAGATFAVSLDASATGGTIDLLNLCNSLAIPNGTTTVNELRGFCMTLPFGNISSRQFGIYINADADNWFKDSIKIGGTAGSDDTVANSSVALELKSTTRAFLPSRMTTTERDALTAINGMILYNTTTDKLQVYAAGVWVDLH